jgi:hypothetical protein
MIATIGLDADDVKLNIFPALKDGDFQTESAGVEPASSASS